MNAACPSEFIAFAHRLADATGAILKRYYRAPLDIVAKPDASPVTAADKEGESAIRAMVAERYPEHGVIGEEFPAEKPDAEYVWVVDPLDGTKSFVTAKPLFATLISLVHGGRAILGVIDHPALGERWIGAAGRPTELNGKPQRVRACPDLAHAVLYTTSPDSFAPDDWQAFLAVHDRVRFAVYGGDAYAFGLLASGFVDLIVESDHGPDDFFPLIPVVEQAGGVMTDWQGRPLGMRSDGRVLAAGDPRVHREALAVLSGSRERRA